MPGAPLQAYLRASDPTEADLHLSQLLAQHAEPLIARVVRARLFLRSNPDHGEVEDVCSEAMVALVSSLDRLRESKDSTLIDNFDGYVTTIARRACSDHFRRRYPMFHRLRNRLRYALRNNPVFGVWQNERGEWVCGRSQWQPDRSKPRLVRAASGSPMNENDLAALPVQDTGALFSAVFGQAGAPVAFDELARIAARCWGVKDTPDPVDAESMALADPATPSDAGTDGVRWVESLWREICSLPPNQRTALLLNLRDEAGACATTVFVATGVAGLPEMAAALDMTVEEFAELWRAMPLDDASIAERLGIKRQQVINLRKCAKERLARRLRNR